MSNTLVEEILDQLKEIRHEQREQRKEHGTFLARLDERLKNLEEVPPVSGRAGGRHKALVASGISAGMVVGIIEGLKAVLGK